MVWNPPNFCKYVAGRPSQIVVEWLIMPCLFLTTLWSHFFAISAHRFSIGLKSGEQAGQGIRTISECSWNHLFTVPAVCIGALSIAVYMGWDGGISIAHWRQHNFPHDLNVLFGSHPFTDDCDFSGSTRCHPAPQTYCDSPAPSRGLDVLWLIPKKTIYTISHYTTETCPRHLLPDNDKRFCCKSHNTLNGIFILWRSLF